MMDCADWQDIISRAIEREASDVHLTAGQRPYMRCDGVLAPMDDRLLTAPFMADFCSVSVSMPIISRGLLRLPSACCRSAFQVLKKSVRPRPGSR